MRRHFFPVLHVLGLVVLLFSSVMLIPISWAWLRQETSLEVFRQTLGLTFIVGLVLYLLTFRYRRDLQPRDGFLLVTLVWSILPVFAALPLIGYFAETGATLSFTDAYFETMSGLTTTGATVLTGLDQLPQSINVWRCTLVWLGGMGILVLAVAVLPLLGIGGSQIYRAETPGPMKDERLTPRITETAKGLYTVYLGISLVCMLAYRWGGMSWYDAYCHMTSTMGLGGFSTHDSSFAWFNSAKIDYIACFFMLLAGFNFAVHFQALRKRTLNSYWQCPEARWYLLVTLSASVLIALYLLQQGQYSSFWTALRFSLFNTISMATTTGYASTDYGSWPIFAPILMLLLSCFASSAGSTGGGVKMIRAVIMFKQARRELVRILHPSVINPVRIGHIVVENKVIFSVLAFMLVYGGTVILMSMILLFSGLDPKTAFSAVIACINNAGPGLGLVGPASTYAPLSDFQTWICTITMLLGRLELFTVLVLFTPNFWRK